MKSFLRLAITLFFVGVVMSSSAQNAKNTPKGTATAKISIPGYCCKGLNATIEKTLAYEKGVVEWTLDQPGKCVNVVYKTGKTDPVKIEKALAANGVRTANEKPNPRAIEKLPKCCQPAARGEKACSNE